MSHRVNEETEFATKNLDSIDRRDHCLRELGGGGGGTGIQGFSNIVYSNSLTVTGSQLIVYSHELVLSLFNFVNKQWKSLLLSGFSAFRIQDNDEWIFSESLELLCEFNIADRRRYIRVDSASSIPADAIQIREHFFVSINTLLTEGLI